MVQLVQFNELFVDFYMFFKIIFFIFSFKSWGFIPKFAKFLCWLLATLSLSNNLSCSLLRLQASQLRILLNKIAKDMRKLWKKLLMCVKILGWMIFLNDYLERYLWTISFRFCIAIHSAQSILTNCWLSNWKWG